MLPDRERQVARRVAVAGADRPQVGVVDQQAAQPDEQARPQIAPAQEMLGLPPLLAEDRGHGFMLDERWAAHGILLHYKVDGRRGRKLPQICGTIHA